MLIIEKSAQKLSLIGFSGPFGLRPPLCITGWGPNCGDKGAILENVCNSIKGFHLEMPYKTVFYRCVWGCILPFKTFYAPPPIFGPSIPSKNGLARVLGNSGGLSFRLFSKKKLKNLGHFFQNFVKCFSNSTFGAVLALLCPNKTRCAVLRVPPYSMALGEGGYDVSAPIDQEIRDRCQKTLKPRWKTT